MARTSPKDVKVPKMGKAFRRIRVAMVGDHYQATQLPQWVRRNGGEFHEKVTDQITHLISTEQAYEDNVEEVQAAKALGKIKIVSRDWLTASLHANPIRPVPERPFLIQNLIKTGKKTAEGGNGADGKTDSGSKARMRTKDPFIEKKSPKASKSAKNNAPTKKVIFRDPQTGAAWDAVLMREGKTTRSREKYRLAIFETNSEPVTYSTWAKYSRVGVSRVEELTPAKSDLASATEAFQQFFKANTGKGWADRKEGKFPPLKADDQGNALPAHEGWWIWENQDNIFTSFLMQAGPCDGNPTSAMDASSGIGDAHGAQETEITRAEDVDDTPEGPLPSAEDHGNNDDVNTDTQDFEVGQNMPVPAVDADIKAGTESE